MNKNASVIVLLLSLLVHTGLRAGTSFHYHVDVTNTATDSFAVTLKVSGLKGDSIIYQFAATAPGTYQVMDVGRLVGSFTARNADGRPLPAHRLSTNQFVIRHASTIATVEYRISDSFDENLQPHPIYLMCGSNIENDNVQINPHMVFGYFHGHQSDPIAVSVTYPNDWIIGTALPLNNGAYYADTFDRLVDSPIFVGRMKKTSFKVGGADIDMYIYSANGEVTAEQFKEPLHKLLIAADQFLDGLPVKNYTFLFHFRPNPIELGTTGAWEHSYSSGYVLPENILANGPATLLGIIAHEFFHIVTPLNIHSEIIEAFNFVKPVASQHLWLYEGTTEWASDMMQVRGGTLSDLDYMAIISEKLNNNDSYNPSVSLVDLALGSFDRYVDQYPNIYEKGALTAIFLDMRILELSKGKQGLQDVIKKLSQRYGPKRAFPEQEFFDIFVKETYPEIADFIDRYIKGTEPLPVEAYLAKAGYEYKRTHRTGEYRPNAGKFTLGFDGTNLRILSVLDGDSVTQELGLQPGDAVLKFVHNGTEIGIFQGVQAVISQLQPGEDIGWIVRRGDQEMRLTAKVRLKEVVENHKISPMAKLTREQEQFRKWWFTNL